MASYDDANIPPLDKLERIGSFGVSNIDSYVFLNEESHFMPLHQYDTAESYKSDPLNALETIGTSVVYESANDLVNPVFEPDFEPNHQPMHEHDDAEDNRQKLNGVLSHKDPMDTMKPYAEICTFMEDYPARSSLVPDVHVFVPAHEIQTCDLSSVEYAVHPKSQALSRDDDNRFAEWRDDIAVESEVSTLPQLHHGHDPLNNTDLYAEIRNPGSSDQTAKRPLCVCEDRVRAGDLNETNSLKNAPEAPLPLPAKMGQETFISQENNRFSVTSGALTEDSALWLSSGTDYYARCDPLNSNTEIYKPSTPDSGYPVSSVSDNNNRMSVVSGRWSDEEQQSLPGGEGSKFIPTYTSVHRSHSVTTGQSANQSGIQALPPELPPSPDNKRQSIRGIENFGLIEDGYTTISKYRNDADDAVCSQQPVTLRQKDEFTPNNGDGGVANRYSSSVAAASITTSRQKTIHDNRVRFGTLDPRKLEDVTKSKMVDGRFVNPWDTWRDVKLIPAFRFLCMRRQGGGIPSKQVLQETLPVVPPNLYKIRSPPSAGINVTWLGHASLLVQFDGITFLTDPVFSDSCGPFRLVGTKRYRPIPCSVQLLPKVHAVVISHNHYDHLDLPTVLELNNWFGSQLRWFVPLGLLDWFVNLGVENVIELDWWQENCIPSHSNVTFAFTPSQHWSRRTAFDKCKSLWGSWSIFGPNHSFFFAGDTGYCEVFKEIGQRYGPFDVAAIPIGAYAPRSFLSPQHVDPTEAVQIHKDIQSKQSVGIHWGTFPLGRESYMAPAEDLKTAVESGGLCEGDFFTMKHGDTKLLAVEEEEEGGRERPVSLSESAYYL